MSSPVPVLSERTTARSVCVWSTTSPPTVVGAFLSVPCCRNSGFLLGRVHPSHGLPSHGLASHGRPIPRLPGVIPRNRFVFGIPHVALAAQACPQLGRSNHHAKAAVAAVSAYWAHLVTYLPASSKTPRFSGTFSLSARLGAKGAAVMSSCHAISTSNAQLIYTPTYFQVLLCAICRIEFGEAGEGGQFESGGSADHLLNPERDFSTRQGEFTETVHDLRAQLNIALTRGSRADTAEIQRMILLLLDNRHSQGMGDPETRRRVFHQMADPSQWCPEGLREVVQIQLVAR